MEKEAQKEKAITSYIVRFYDNGSFFQLPVGETGKTDSFTGTSSIQRDAVQTGAVDILGKVIINEKPEKGTFLSFANPYDKRPVVLKVTSPLTNPAYLDNKKRQLFLEEEKTSVYVKRVFPDEEIKGKIINVQAEKTVDEFARPAIALSIN